MTYIGQIGLATLLFCVCSLMVGYFVPRLLGVNSFQAKACAFEIGIHNSTLAMTIAFTVMAAVWPLCQQPFIHYLCTLLLQSLAHC